MMWSTKAIRFTSQPPFLYSYLVASEYGSVETSWWNDNETTTSVIDFTKPAARQWYLDRLHLLKNTSGVDSFKFDGGESSWSPQVNEIYWQIFIIIFSESRKLLRFPIYFYKKTFLNHLFQAAIFKQSVITTGLHLLSKT